MAGVLRIEGIQTGLPTGVKQIGPLNITMSVTGQTTEVALVMGANTIIVPAVTVACLIIPPPGNVTALTLKGVGADTGITISPSLPSLVTFPAAPPASFVVNAAAAIVAVTEFVFV